MNFLKNHYEKLILVVVFIGWIVSAGLVWKKLKDAAEARKNEVAPKTTGEPLKDATVDTKKIIAKYEAVHPWQPQQATAHKIFTPNYKGVVLSTTGGQQRLDVGKQQERELDRYFPITKSFRVAGIPKQLFNLKFEGVIDAGNNVLKFQINFQGGTKFAKLKETIEGFTIIKHEPKREGAKDASELTLKRGDLEVVLVINRQQQIQTDLIAQVTVNLTGQAFNLKTGDVFPVEYHTDEKATKKVKTQMKVIDIKADHVIVEDVATKIKYHFGLNAKEGVKIE